MLNLPPRRAKLPKDAEPGDELGTWPRKRLLKMDESFVRRVERAFASGRERRELATATVDTREADHARAD